MRDDPTKWFDRAAQAARDALCLRAKCGAVLVKNGEILSVGYNGPPRDNLSLRMCLSLEPSRRKPKSDRTCCLHAEWNALEDALSLWPDEVEGSTMVFCRVGDDGQMLKSGNPYCTVCSRLTLHRGVESWLLWQDGGIRCYSALEYHQLSERYDFVSEGTFGLPIEDAAASLGVCGFGEP